MTSRPQAAAQSPADDADRLLTTVEAWIADDPDPACRTELRELIGREDHRELAERFRDRLRFGTAGLRGPLGAGPNRMNLATVRGVTAGVAAYLLATVSDSPHTGVVIGYDARHGSERFADETAKVLTGAGLRAYRLPGRLPTPVLAFAVRHLACAAGIMITASHNPAGDNGYKVYLGDGAQIVPPTDIAISTAIDRIGPLAQVPLGGPGLPVGAEIVDAYLCAIIAALPDSRARQLTTVYTPLHGVGRDVLLEGFNRAGFPSPHVVATQGDPDPDFPTVNKPNPEEPGTLDLAIIDARGVGADLLLANDPDADRLAVAIPAPSDPAGWRVLTGDELGALLGDYLISRTADPGHSLVVTTIVSSGVLRGLAQAAGVRYSETLTGFKWIMHAAATSDEDRLVFGYEEALGYAVNDLVRDKDGISAALVVAGMAAEAKHRGSTLGDELDDIARRVGLHATEQFSLELPGKGEQRNVDEIMAGLRASPPTQLLGSRIDEIDDVRTGVRRFSDGHEEPLGLPPSDVLIWRSREHARIIVRPSGTEPKLKVYLQVVIALEEGDDLDEAKATARRELARLRDELRPALNPPPCGPSR